MGWRRQDDQGQGLAPSVGKANGILSGQVCSWHVCFLMCICIYSCFILLNFLVLLWNSSVQWGSISTLPSGSRDEAARGPHRARVWNQDLHFPLGWPVVPPLAGPWPSSPWPFFLSLFLPFSSESLVAQGGRGEGGLLACTPLLLSHCNRSGASLALEHARFGTERSSPFGVEIWFPLGKRLLPDC